ncbi:MAG: GFA family protein [Loktanella sp.]|nr:GFA family protein [Loktanella sp.]MDO7622820.1 GFA family protein [Loktanella sp.]MDO7626773.1 GFA family protein [Loktanella sp.]MDO7724215.1 GFA family protein [Loktanella sp.]
MGQENGTWQLLGDQPRTYNSSAGQQRGFCGTCGSTMFYRSEQYPNEMHFYAALLDNPEHISPQQHYHADERLSWVHLSEGLPIA